MLDCIACKVLMRQCVNLRVFVRVFIFGRGHLPFEYTIGIGFRRDDSCAENCKFATIELCG